ncbi:hypothetical protein ACFV4X_26350 [Streptomyces ardesiacus]|uniref:hypothetical protein n=1 Tax=Streptomyces ardesiacus TaxID=285564 RepID=UPI003666E45F
MTAISPQPGDIVRVTYAAVWAPEDGDPRMVLTGNDGSDRWHNIVPDNATVEILHRPAKELKSTGSGLCVQNRRAGQPEPHYYDPADQRCVFCHVAVHWGGEPARTLRTPDGRVWQLAAESAEDGDALYEAPFVGCRYTAAALEQLHAEQGDVVVITDPAPPYVHSALSKRRTVKHIPNGGGRAMCPTAVVVSEPMPEKEAARLTLCDGCRQARLAEVRAAKPACLGAAIDHDETGVCNHA